MGCSGSAENSLHVIDDVKVLKFRKDATCNMELACIFANLLPDEIDDIVSSFKILRIKRGDNLVLKGTNLPKISLIMYLSSSFTLSGARAHKLFAVICGELTNIETQSISKDGDWIGIVPFAKSSIYEQTVVAKKDTTLHALSRNDFETVTDSVSVQVRRVKLFSKIKAPDVLYPFCSVKRYSRGQTICKRMQKIDSFYFVLEGSVVRIADRIKFGIQSYFGDDLIDNDARWTADMKAKENVVVFIINREGFYHPKFSPIRKDIERAYTLKTMDPLRLKIIELAQSLEYVSPQEMAMRQQRQLYEASKLSVSSLSSTFSEGEDAPDADTVVPPKGLMHSPGDPTAALTKRHRRKKKKNPRSDDIFKDDDCVLSENPQVQSTWTAVDLISFISSSLIHLSGQVMNLAQDTNPLTKPSVTTSMDSVTNYPNGILRHPVPSRVYKSMSTIATTDTEESDTSDWLFGIL